MFNTLYSKLAAVLLGLFALVAVGAVIGTLHVLNLYSLEATQKLNRSLAGHLAAQNMVASVSADNTDRLRTLFNMQMMINPSIQIYLLDGEGNVLSSSAQPGTLARKRVSMAPIADFLSANPKFPILGDDPRDVTQRRIFSVAPIERRSASPGYLYAVLAEPPSPLAGALLDSHVLKLAAGGLVVTIVLALVMGLLVFGLITSKLERLDAVMQAFQASDFSKRPYFPTLPTGKPRDEIDRLSLSLRELASRIVSQMQKLKQTDRLRRELVANVSHDLKTPLASLQGYVDTLLIKDDILSSEERHHYLGVASRSCERLGKLVSDLIELAKLDAQEVVPHLETFSAAELLQDVAQKFQLKAEQSAVGLSISAPQGSPYVRADIGLIERVLENLIANALAHTPPGGTVRLAVESSGSTVALQVRDSGSGIPEEEIEHIFERFYRVNGASWEQGGNAGLGLAITKSILDLHGSKMQVDSKLGVGTSFTFTLPAAVLRAASGPDRALAV